MPFTSQSTALTNRSVLIIYIPEFFKHHSEYITYADTIAPIFLFVAGVGFRLSFLRNRAKEGLRRALWIGFRRYLILTLVGIVYYDPINWRGWWIRAS